VGNFLTSWVTITKHTLLQDWYQWGSLIGRSVYWLGYGLDDRGSIPGTARDCFLFATASRPAQGLTQPPIQWVPRAFTPGVRRSGREAELLSPSPAKVKNAWSHTSTPPYVLMAWHLVNDWDNFAFYLYLIKEQLECSRTGKRSWHWSYFQVEWSLIYESCVKCLLSVALILACIVVLLLEENPRWNRMIVLGLGVRNDIYM
jgi:hypothetical protein